jgi:hypothetical protein
LEIALDVHAAKQAAHHTVAHDRILPATGRVNCITPTVLKHTALHQSPFDAVCAASARLDAVTLTFLD